MARCTIPITPGLTEMCDTGMTKLVLFEMMVTGGDFKKYFALLRVLEELLFVENKDAVP